MIRGSAYVFFLAQSAFFYYVIILSSKGSAIASGHHHLLGNETDQLALRALKAQITHDPLQILSSWNASLHFCKWYGVTCGHKHQRVVRLSLKSLGLVGSLSPYIGNLSFLHTLNLQNNSFNGKIPLEVGRLFRLKAIKVHNNSFGGVIPISLSNCSNLLTINLGHNELTGTIPNEISSLPKLVELYFYQNNITGGLPPSLGNLSYLESFSVAYNNLYGSIPESIGQIKNLQDFSLSANMFYSTVPPLIYNISTLQFFSISQNNFSGTLPPNVGRALSDLQVFLIGGNKFSGSIPTSLFNCSKLQDFDVSVNGFSGQIPTNVGSLQNLQWLNLQSNYLGHGETNVNDLEFLSSMINCTDLRLLDFTDNKFGGILPTSVTNLSSQLDTLFLAANQISGSIPSGIENLANLIGLAMNGNKLSGRIPIGIGKLQNLQQLALGENNLSSKIPPTLGNLSRLYFLDLSNNNFEGDIVSSISNCQLLKELDLSKNNLRSRIPEEILNLPLLYLYLDQNYLTGPLPMEIGKLKNLVELNVSHNKFFGLIPSTLGSCVSLETLSLSGNFFHGSIPLSFNYFKEITTLDLSMNNISGLIPLFLQNLSSLQYLNLSFNDLEGEVPINGVFQNVTSFSIVANKKLCGGVPQLHLRPCLNKNSNKQRTSLALKVSLSVSLPMIALVCSLLLFLYWKRRKSTPSRKPPTEHRCWEDHFERLSYKDLHEATEGFSTANLIGKGSFGSVYKGVFRGDKEVIAVKVLDLMERGSLKTFMAECEALRNVRHRNLLKILTICSSIDSQGNDFKALIFRFMPNGNLGNWLHPSSDGKYILGRLNLSQRINIAIDIASALDYLHNHCETPIVHRDLKPSNILLDNDMVAHIADFGLAKFLHESKSKNHDSKETSSISAKGTIGYIPPEYGVGVGASTQGDMYSFGVVMLEMITGKRPTNEMFKDGLDLHHYSMRALLEQVSKVIDPTLLSYEIQGNMRDEVQGCLISMVKVGIACSIESPGGRMPITDALRELLLIKDRFVGIMN